MEEEFETSVHPSDGLGCVPKTIALEHKVQHHLRCDECLNYLSVGPVTITGNRRTFCGRCLVILGDEVNVSKSFLNLILQDVNFLCINHYDGCKSILRFDKTRHHEVNCLGRNYDCIFCSYQAQNGSQMVFHYDKYHPKNVIKGDEKFSVLPLIEHDETRMIYFDDCNILLLTTMFENGVIKMSTYYINELSENESCYIRFEKDDYCHLFHLKLVEYGKEAPRVEVDVQKLKLCFLDLTSVYCKIEVDSKTTQNQINDMTNLCEEQKTMLVEKQKTIEIKEKQFKVLLELFNEASGVSKIGNEELPQNESTVGLNIWYIWKKFMSLKLILISILIAFVALIISSR